MLFLTVHIQCTVGRFYPSVKATWDFRINARDVERFDITIYIGG